MAEKKLFRSKSLEKISSPEQLNDYISVTTPAVWMLLSGIILILIGAVVWGIFGELDTRLTVPAIVHDNMAELYVKADDVSSIELYQDVEIEDYEGIVLSLGNESIKAEEVLGDLILTEVGYDDGDIVYSIGAGVDAPDGIYIADIIVDTVSPMSFLTNDEKK